MTIPDLNQPRTFVVLYELRSFTATAEFLHVTQPTVSYTLARLRRALADDLPWREGYVMVPTTRATQLKWPLHEALAQIESTVSETASFDPSAFYGRALLGPTLIGEQTFLPDHGATGSRAIDQRLAVAVLTPTRWRKSWCADTLISPSPWRWMPHASGARRPAPGSTWRSRRGGILVASARSRDVRRLRVRARVIPGRAHLPLAAASRTRTHAAGRTDCRGVRHALRVPARHGPRHVPPAPRCRGLLRLFSALQTGLALVARASPVAIFTPA